MILYSVLIITVLQNIFGETIGLENQQECVVPNPPTNGHLLMVGANSSANPGDKFPPGTVIAANCTGQYKLEGASLSLCSDGKWSEKIGECLMMCPPIPSSASMEVKCTTPNGSIDNCRSATNGTLATLKCARYYEDPNLNRDPFLMCIDGKWNKELPNCRPICGIKPVQATTLLANGVEAVKSDYPWQMALYTISRNTKTLTCGGSLLNPRVILTAAHCVTDNKGKPHSKELFLVAGGKYYRNLNDSRDTGAQFSSVQEIFVPRQYRGEIRNYFGDIALIVTVESFSISRYVQPVCIDWDSKSQTQFLTESSKGFVAGWGYTQENSSPSDILKNMEVLYVDNQKCMTELPPDYEIYLTSDKICSGFSNKSVAVCQGDGGGGLVFKNTKDGRYYITGIVSLGSLSPTGGCDGRFALYTRVSDYSTNFILSKVNLYWD